MAQDGLGENLRLLCSHYKSVAEACRRIGLNRQQFNKYLSGQTRPSLHNLQRIGDFFGVDEAELMLPHETFAETVLRHPRADGGGQVGRFVATLGLSFPDSQADLKPYCGFYHSYFYSPANPGLIVRALVSVFQSEGHTYSKGIERLTLRTKRRHSSYVFKYQGVLLYANDRIYLLEHEAVLNKHFAMTVFYPTHRSSIVLVSGLCLSVTGNHARQPFATRTVYEYLGTAPNLSTALRACGLFDADSGDIDPEIKRRIHNAVAPEERALRAADF